MSWYGLHPRRWCSLGVRGWWKRCLHQEPHQNRLSPPSCSLLFFFFPNLVTSRPPPSTSAHLRLFFYTEKKKKPSISSQKTHASHQILPQSDLIINPVFTCTVHSCPTISPPHTNLLPFSRCPPPSTLPFRFQAPEEEEKETAPTAN